jgi:hypothetical protein
MALHAETERVAETLPHQATGKSLSFAGQSHYLPRANSQVAYNMDPSFPTRKAQRHVARLFFTQGSSRINPRDPRRWDPRGDQRHRGKRQSHGRQRRRVIRTHAIEQASQRSQHTCAE